MSFQSPLHVLVLSDGRPGHYRQSEGLLKALGRLYNVSSYWVEAFPHFPSVGTHAASLMVRMAGPLRSNLWPLLYNLEDQVLPDHVDLIVSAGSKTLIPNIILAQRLGCFNFFSGSLRNVSPNLLTASITNYPDNTRRENIILSLKPNAVDPLVLGESSERCITVLVGGDSGTHSYAIEDWSNLLKLIRELKYYLNKPVEVLTSRRTGSLGESILHKGASMGMIDKLQLYSEVGAQPVADSLKDSALILCTEDSNSMLTECVCSQRPVISLQPKTRSVSRKEQQYLDWLENEGWVRTVRLADHDVIQWPQVINRLRPYDHDHLEALAALLDPFLEKKQASEPQES